MIVATRSTRHFEPLGVSCLNPWDRSAWGLEGERREGFPDTPPGSGVGELGMDGVVGDRLAAMAADRVDFELFAGRAATSGGTTTSSDGR
jgi:hypothetical protein